MTLYKTIDLIPENNDPSDDNWVLNTDPNNGNALQKTRLLDAVKARYNPASGWVLRDGSINPISVSAGDKIIAFSSSLLELTLPTSNNFGDEITILNIGVETVIYPTIAINGRTDISEIKIPKNAIPTLIYIDNNYGWYVNANEVTLITQLPVLSLLHMDAPNGSISFTDEVGNSYTPYGDAQISTAQSKFGGSSGYFDGNSDKLLSDIGFFDQKKDFTVEFFLYLISGRGYLFSTGYNDLGTFAINYVPSEESQYNNFDQLGFVFWDNNANFSAERINYQTIPFNQWVHLATSKKGNNWKLFQDGVLILEFNKTIGLSSVAKPELAYSTPRNNTSDYTNGYFDEFRISEGAIYESDFTPPSSPFIY